MDPDDELQGDDPILSNPFVGEGGGGPPNGGEKGPTSAADAPASLLDQGTGTAAQQKSSHRRLGWEGHSTRGSRPLLPTLWWNPTTAFGTTCPTVH
jgi:hypothetical protein